VQKERPAAAAADKSLGVVSGEIEISMAEELDLADITTEIARLVSKSGLKNGVANVFVPGATGAVTCLEFEPGVIADFKAAIERIAPREMHYDHNVYQADGNGHARIRAGLMSPSMSIPFIDGELTLGVWQQVVLVNCDNRRRTRRVVVQMIGA